MCTIVFAYESHPEYRLVLAGNRDEIYQRPTAPAQFWSDNPELLAGRDLRSGGTWLGASLSGRFATVTNFRSPRPYREDARSRGVLARDFLASLKSPERFMRDVQRSAAEYNGFCLLAGDMSELWFCSNNDGPPRRLSPGVYGLSNHLLDTPWPKVERSKERFEAILSDGAEIAPERLLELLTDRTRAADELLPDTGVGLERERVLSSIFVTTPGYGTRSSTVLLMDRNDQLTFVERTYSPKGDAESTARYDFRIRH